MTELAKAREMELLERNPTFDDILKNGHQSEFDRRVQKAIDTALGKAKEKWQALTDDKLSEAGEAGKDDKRRKGSVYAAEA